MPPPQRPGQPPQRPGGFIQVPVNSDVLKRLELHAKAWDTTVPNFAQHILKKAAEAPVRRPAGRRTDDGGNAFAGILAIIILGAVVVGIVLAVRSSH
jgi:hypothetical protein